MEIICSLLLFILDNWFDNDPPTFNKSLDCFGNMDYYNCGRYIVFERSYYYIFDRYLEKDFYERSITPKNLKTPTL